MARSISSERPSSSKAGRLSVADSTVSAALASSAASKAAGHGLAGLVQNLGVRDVGYRITHMLLFLICTRYGHGMRPRERVGSALIHTKTGAHREDVAQHAGDRFGSHITRRPDAAALSDGADSPRVSIPVLRMPPRKPQMTGRSGPSRDSPAGQCLNLQQILSKNRPNRCRLRYTQIS